NKRKRLFLIDGYAMLYRAHYALIRNPLVTSYGLHTSALFGFVNQVFRLIKQEKPDYFAAIFDSKEKTFRHKMYSEYKSHRPPMPDELQSQLPHLWDLLDAMQIPTMKQPGFEADDIIGTLAKEGEREDIDVYIVSADKDFMQLMNDHIYLYAPGRRNEKPTIYDVEGVTEKWGVPPDKIIDLLGMMGDSSDNVPGVKGVGKKTAVKLIKKYGSLEASLTNAESQKNARVRRGLMENQEMAKLSKELVTIDINMDLEKSVRDLELQSFNTDLLATKLTELEFHALVNQLISFSQEDAVPEYDSPKKNYQTIRTIDALEKAVQIMEKAELISFDIETTSLQAMETDIVGLSFSIAPNEGWYIPILFKDKSENLFGKDDLKIVLDACRNILENEDIILTGQNIKFDALVMKNHDVHLAGIAFDSLLAAHLVNPVSRSYKLETLSLELLNYPMLPIEDLIGKGRKQITMAEVALEKTAFYAAEDADVTGQITSILQKKLKEEELYSFYQKIELPLIPVLLDMEFNGTFVDKEFLAKMSDDLGEKLDRLVSDIHSEAGTEFNVNSTQQLANVLFDIKGLEPIKKRSTAEPILQKLKEKHPIPGLVLDYRKFNKMKNTYVDALPNLIHPKTGRIHGTFNQFIAATGRLSSTNPNFQNIPIRHEEGREIRKAFCAQKSGWKILSADYSQVELRIMAHLSQDPELIKAFQNGEDIHARTASLVFGVPIEKVIPEMRRTAKVVNFGIMYGAGAFRMSQELGIPRAEAQLIIDTYFRQYAGIRNYVDQTLEKARTEKMVETVLGRRRPVWDADSDNGLRRQAAERMAINMPVQGTAAEMIKLAMIHIRDRMIEEKLEAKMVLQVHDELIFEVPENEVDSLAALVVKEMENALPLSVPVVVDWGVGESWFEAH
ncbi:MAG: DNA polymerase I, partial [Candidatus Marinimicrobia bacterium]|nr:DNA polymerase I [Candidatus Neomarinimicrobiota bacterium]